MTIDDASAALQQIRYSLFVVGTQGDEGPHFMIANWGTQASFDPWRFVVAVKTRARTLANLKANLAFTVNLLDAAEEPLVREIQKRKGEGVPAESGPATAPRLAAAYAGLDCKVIDVVDTGGDHALVIADVVDGWKRGDGTALTLPDLRLSYAG